MADAISGTDLSTALVALPDWDGDSQALRRTVTAPDFRSGIRLVDAVADIAEQMDHHPDIDIRWRTISFVLSTHSAGGVTALDVQMANRIDDLVRGFDAPNAGA